MDDTDRKLIDRLRENARAPVAELARALGLSRTTVQSRLQRLERTGAISGYTVKLSPAAVEPEVLAYVMIVARSKQAGLAVNAVRKLTAVRKLESVAGAFDLMALVSAPTMLELDRLIDHIGELEGVERTSSTIILSSKVDRT